MTDMGTGIYRPLWDHPVDQRLRDLFIEKWNKDIGNNNTRIMEELCEAWDTDTDGVKSINWMFARYFGDTNLYGNQSPRQIMDDVLISLFGWSFATIAEKAGYFEENDDG